MKIANLENNAMPTGEGDMVLWPAVILGAVILLD